MYNYIKLPLCTVFSLIIFSSSIVLSQNYPPVPTKEGTKFFYKVNEDSNITSVAVAGTFNDWDPDQYTMQQDGSGLWSVTVPLKEGMLYHYKFVINDTLWITDPSAPDVTEDEWRNGIIVPQEYGKPFVKEIFPQDGKRITKISRFSAVLGSDFGPIDSKSITLLLDGKKLKFKYDKKKQIVTANFPSNIKDGEHLISLSYSDVAGNKKENFISRFFLDRFETTLKTPAFYDTAIMYEVFIRSFWDSDGDGIGDFDGLKNSLSYIHDTLGINTLWLMPFNESTTPHGYNVVDYYSIESDYGTREDYFEFLKEAKNRGIRIVMDFVINHTDSTHPWFLDAYRNPSSKYSDWYQFRDSTNTDWFHFGVERKMPKLDFNNTEVHEYFLKVAEYWMDPNSDGNFEDGIDGFRCDAAKEVPHIFWSKLRKHIKKIRPDILLLGEVWDNANFLIPFFKDEFDMLYNYPVLYALDEFIENGDPSRLIRRSNEMRELYPAGHQFVTFLSNHDNHRAISRYNSIGQLKAAMFFIFSTHGLPMIYYGDELGMEGRLPPENVRKKMEWENLFQQMQDNNSILNFHRKLISLRKNFPALSARNDKSKKSLKFVEIKGTQSVLGYIRESGGEVFLAVINRTGDLLKEISVDRKTNPEINGASEIILEEGRNVPFGRMTSKITLEIKDDLVILNNLYLEEAGFLLLKLKK